MRRAATTRLVRGKAQTEIGFRTLDKNGQLRGGARRGAGRKPKGVRAGARHKARDIIDPRHPQHVTLRVVDDIANLRRPDMYAAIRGALEVAARHDNFRIVHFSLQGNHIHLVCEAASKAALAAGVKGFEISAAKRINAVMTKLRGQRRRGQVFADRYHVRAIKSVRDVRNTISYVLNNHRHHALGGRLLFDGKLDPYSSAVFFPGWAERTVPEIHIPDGYEPPRVCRPETWLLAEGWRRAAPISCFDVPG
jgi:REP element-mobilizing transposase RayT